MTSGKLKRQSIDRRRADKASRKRRQKLHTETLWGVAGATPQDVVGVNTTALAPYRSYGFPEFVSRGFYVDQSFECACCGVQETWRATQQKWWYEVAKGPVYSTAKYCARCRRKRREGRWRREDDEAEMRRRSNRS